MDSEATLKPGDVCFDCLKIGLVKYLRFFKINLYGGTLLKCESSSCMYPYNDEFSSDDEEGEIIKPTLTNDLLPQLNHAWTAGAATNGENNTNELADFDITFLDDLHANEHISVCESGVTVDVNKFADVNDNTNKYLPLPNVATSMNCEAIFNSGISNSNEQKDIKLAAGNKPLENHTQPDTTHGGKTSYVNNTGAGIKKGHKEKIIIQSVETRYPTSAKMFADITLISPSTSNAHDIPKANINKENIFSKANTNTATNSSDRSIKPKNQVKKVTNKLPKRTKKSVVQTEELENEMEEESQKTIDYSLDRISELLQSVRKK